MPRKHATAAVLDGKVHVMSGQRTDSGVIAGPATNLVEVYGPASNTWSATKPMSTVRAHLALARIDGRPLAAGGEDVNRSLALLESQDPATNVWF